MAKLNMKDIILICLDKEKTVKKLQEWGTFGTEGMLKCPDCSGIFKLSKTQTFSCEDGYYWRCYNKVSKNKKKKALCNKRQSVRTNTFLANSRLTIEQIMIFVHLWCLNIELQVIQIQATISKSTAVDWNSFCREVAIEFCLREGKAIGGPNMTVEIDECKFGKRKYNSGRFVEGQWVFGGVCRETGEFFLVPEEQRDGLALKMLIKKWILPGSTIIGDCWNAYKKLDEATIQDLTVNHSVNFKDCLTEANTYIIEGLWRHFKYRLPIYNRRKEFFVGNISKFIFINFCKSKGLDPTIAFFKVAGALYSPYEDKSAKLLVGENEDEYDEEDVEEEE